jgi:hypothetical protein
MTQDEIIEMARDTANHGTHASGEIIYTFYLEQLVAFANLVAAKEREACAKVADELVGQDLEHNFSTLIAHNIRARGYKQDGQCKRCKDGCPACDATKLPKEAHDLL